MMQMTLLVKFHLVSERVFSLPLLKGAESSYRFEVAQKKWEKKLSGQTDHLHTDFPSSYANVFSQFILADCQGPATMQQAGIRTSVEVANERDSRNYGSRQALLATQLAICGCSLVMGGIGLEPTPGLDPEQHPSTQLLHDYRTLYIKVSGNASEALAPVNHIVIGRCTKEPAYMRISQPWHPQLS